MGVVAIVGCGIAGDEAAFSARRADPESKVIIITKEHRALYSACVLADYVAGAIPKKRITLKTPEDYERAGIELNLSANVIGYSPDQHLLHLEDRDVKVDRLILESSFGLFNDVSLLHKLCSVPVLAKANSRGKRTALEERLNLEFYKPDFVAQEIVGRSYLFMQMPEARRVMLNIMHNWVDAHGLRPEAILMDRLPLIQSPTLIIHCVQDRIHPLRLFRNAWRRIPDARIRILSGCGHCPHIEKAAEFNETVIEFLETN